MCQIRPHSEIVRFENPLRSAKVKDGKEGKKAVVVK